MPASHRNPAWLAALLLTPLAAWAEPPAFAIDTVQKGRRIHTRPVTPTELRNVATALTESFRDGAPGYNDLLEGARAMSPQARCFNLMTVRTTQASVEAGKVPASPIARAFLKHAANSLDEVNGQTSVTCAMRALTKGG